MHCSSSSNSIARRQSTGWLENAPFVAEQQVSTCAHARRPRRVSAGRRLRRSLVRLERTYGVIEVPTGAPAPTRSLWGHTLMRLAAWSGSLSGMDRDDRVRLCVRLERGGEPLSGSVQLGDDSPREFIGVLGLLALIEDLRSSEPAGTDCPDARLSEP